MSNPIHRNWEKRLRARAATPSSNLNTFPFRWDGKNKGNLYERPWSAFFRLLNAQHCTYSDPGRTTIPNMHPRSRLSERPLLVWASAAALEVWFYWILPPHAIYVTATCGRRGGQTGRWRSRRRAHDLTLGIAAAAAAGLHRVGPLPSSAPPSSPSPQLWFRRSSRLAARRQQALGECLWSMSAVSRAKR